MTKPEGEENALGFVSHCMRCESEKRYAVYVCRSGLHANMKICWKCLWAHHPLDAAMLERHERLGGSAVSVGVTVVWPRFIYKN